MMPAEQTGTGQLILVVEDQDDIRRTICTALTGGGYQVVEASTGTEALGTARARGPDLILLDLGLPEMNGLDVAQLLNREPDTRLTPLVALTGSWLGSDPAALAEVGFAGALRKPFRVPALLAEVYRVLHTEKVDALPEPLP